MRSKGPLRQTAVRPFFVPAFVPASDRLTFHSEPLDTHGSPDDFLALLPPEQVRELHERRDSACGLWPDLTIAYVNPAWARFAKDNGASNGFPARWREGAPFLDGVGKPLREYYRSHLLAALRSSQIWSSEYECSSPKLFRLYRMDVTPVGLGRGLLVTHTRLAQLPHTPSLTRGPVDPAPYLDEHGHIPQCMHCRRVQRADAKHQWDWVPLWVEQVPDAATGSLCTECIAARYPELAKELGESLEPEGRAPSNQPTPQPRSA